MRIGLDVSSMQHFRWRDFAVRFVFGGIITALTGLIARRYGPGVAGLFLAFPAIFPAGATLIEKQQRANNLVQLNGSAQLPAVSGVNLTGMTNTQVGLGSVTNNAQTKASIMPNTLPTAGYIPIGNAGGTAYAPLGMTGDCTLASSGVVTR